MANNPLKMYNCKLKGNGISCTIKKLGYPHKGKKCTKAMFG